MRSVIIPNTNHEVEIFEDGSIIKKATVYYRMHLGKRIAVPVPERSLIGSKLSKKGYQRVNITPLGVKFVHRLIAELFIPNPENKPQVNHIDGNKLNNHINNLEWVTNQENRDHAVANDLVVRRDKNCTHQKVTTVQCLEIVKLYESGKLRQWQIAEIYGICQQTVSIILRDFTKNEELAALQK
jgi:DNA-binding transcriptional regulator YiaG